MKYDKLLKAFQLFSEHIGKSITVQDILDATQWKEATAKTYISKKWVVFLRKNRDKSYEVTEKFTQFDQARFLELSTQKVLHDHFPDLPTANATTVVDNEYAVENAYLDQLYIHEFLFFEDIQLTDLAHSKEIYFLGENGDGKTLLLQAVLILLKRNFLQSQTSKEFLGKIQDLFPNLDLFGNHSSPNSQRHQLAASDQHGTEYQPQSQYYVKNIFAYGVHRSYHESQPREPYGFSSLFTHTVTLEQPDHWLSNIYALELESQSRGDKYNPISLSTIIDLLKEILGDNIDIQVSIKDGVKYIERGTEIRFDLLSEGYKSVLVWVIDLLSRLIQNQPSATKTNDFSGIVLVDEINLHLHPKWEFSLVPKLRAWFPKLQFIFTTHGPITILGASQDAIFYRLYKENGKTKVSEPYSASQLKHLMANAIITSPLFDLDTARMRIFNQQDTELDTSEDYLRSRIHAEVERQMKTLKSAGKVYLSSKEIDDLVQLAISQLQEP